MGNRMLSPLTALLITVIIVLYVRLRALQNELTTIYDAHGGRSR
jgi:hypothetical protein